MWLHTRRFPVSCTTRWATYPFGEHSSGVPSGSFHKNVQDDPAPVFCVPVCASRVCLPISEIVMRHPSSRPAIDGAASSSFTFFGSVQAPAGAHPRVRYLNDLPATSLSPLVASPPAPTMCYNGMYYCPSDDAPQAP